MCRVTAVTQGSETVGDLCNHPTSANMDSTLSDSLSYLRSATASLHQDIESLMGAADGATFATVMGTGAKSTGRWTPAEMHEYIANDEELTAAGINMTDDERMGSDRAIRRLIYGYGDDIAGAVFEHTLNSWGTEMEEPIRDKINGLVVLVGKIDAIINDCVDKAKDLQKLDAKAVIGHRIVQEYDTNIEFVCETASKLNRYDVNIGKFTVAIDTLMYNCDVDGAKAQQDLRGSMIAERRFVESMLHSHFDATSTSGKSAVKITLRDLKVPDALEKGKGVHGAYPERQCVHQEQSSAVPRDYGGYHQDPGGVEDGQLLHACDSSK